MKSSTGKSSITCSISSASLKKAMVRGKNQFAFEASCQKWPKPWG